MSAAKKIPVFKRGAAVEEEVLQVGLPPVSASAGSKKTTQAFAVTLPPTWFLIGAGNTGKTMFARWASERAQDAGRPIVVSAVDPTNRTLAGFFDGVAQPESQDALETTQWLKELVNFLMQEKAPAVIDMGGGDTSLSKLINMSPGFHQVMEDEGVAPVAAYFLSPRVDDLAMLATYEVKRFRPKATVLILNEGLTQSGDAFDSVEAHPAFRAAVDRGAVVIRMPGMEQKLALAIERKRLLFGQARDGLVPEGRKIEPVGGIDRSFVRRWLEEMDEAFEPIKSWLP